MPKQIIDFTDCLPYSNSSKEPGKNKCPAPNPTYEKYLMLAHYQDYYWKSGKPCGFNRVDPLLVAFSYRIVSDPYFKRFTVEKYVCNRFEKIVYDSALLDFRHLTLTDQMAWQREILQEENERMISLLRDQNDRAILTEDLFFENNRCKTCTTFSIHGLLLSIHHMYYKDLKDPFNGTVLYDSEGKLVMRKIYEIDPSSGEFTDLLSEERDFMPSAT